VIVAGEKYGVGSTIQTTLFDAWSKVGLSLPPSLTRKSQPPAKRDTSSNPLLQRKAA
jgi:hypothetical protein